MFNRQRKLTSAVLLLFWAWRSRLIEAVTSSAKLCVRESAGVSTLHDPAQFIVTNYDTHKKVLINS